jgi:hypothetical protein
MDILADDPRHVLRYVRRRHTGAVHVAYPDDPLMPDSNQPAAVAGRQERFNAWQPLVRELVPLVCGDVAEVFDPVEDGPHEWITEPALKDVCSKCLRVLGDQAHRVRTVS